MILWTYRQMDRQIRQDVYITDRLFYRQNLKSEVRVKKIEKN